MAAAARAAVPHRIRRGEAAAAASMQVPPENQETTSDNPEQTDTSEDQFKPLDENNLPNVSNNSNSV